MGQLFWVRGGTWKPERGAGGRPEWLSAVEDTGRVARLLPVAPDRHPVGRAPVFVPDPTLPSIDWWNEVGEPAGLASYELTDRLAGECLNRVSEFVRSYPFVPAGPIPLETDEALCALLEEFGPLEAVLGVVPAPLSWDLEGLRTVPLGCYHLQVQQLAAAFEAVTGQVGDRRQLSEQLREDSAAALTDVQVEPLFAVDRVTFDFRPRSLRAQLWRHLFWIWGRNPIRFCRLCDARFEVEYGEGSPPRFCPEHRNQRDRKRAQRLRRPVTSLVSED